MEVILRRRTRFRNKALKEALLNRAKVRGQSHVSLVTKNVKSLDDLLAIHMLMPKEDLLQKWLVDYVRDHSAKMRLVDLVDLHQFAFPGSELANLASTMAEALCHCNEDWLSVLDMLTKHCRLADKAINRLMEAPQSKSAYFQMMWFLPADSPLYGQLEKIILAGSENFTLEQWDEISIDAIPGSGLQKKAESEISRLAA